MSKIKSVKSNMIWNSFGNIIYLFAQWLTTIVIVRLTNYEIAGTYALAISITNILYSISLWGIRNYQVSDLFSKYSDGEYIGARFVTCIFSILICFILLFFSSYPLEQKLVIFSYMLFRIVEAIADVIHGIEQKESRMDYIGLSCMIRGLLNILSFTIIIYVTRNLISTILGMTVLSAAVIVLYDCHAVKKVANTIQSFSLNGIIRLIKECSFLSIYSIILAAIPSIPRFYLEQIKGAEMLGIYSTIATPAVIIQTAMIYIMAPIIVPISKNYSDGNKKEILHYIRIIVGIITILVIISILGAILFGSAGLEILFGKDILNYSFLLIPVIFATLSTALSIFVNTLLTIFREFKGLLISTLAGFVAIFFISTWLIQNFGLKGTSYAHIISMLLQIGIGIMYTIKSLKKLSNNTN